MTADIIIIYNIFCWVIELDFVSLYFLRKIEKLFINFGDQFNTASIFLLGDFEMPLIYPTFFIVFSRLFFLNLLSFIRFIYRKKKEFRSYRKYTKN